MTPEHSEWQLSQPFCRNVLLKVLEDLHFDHLFWPSVSLFLLTYHIIWEQFYHNREQSREYPYLMSRGERDNPRKRPHGVLERELGVLTKPESKDRLL